MMYLFIKPDAIVSDSTAVETMQDKVKAISDMSLHDLWQTVSGSAIEIAIKIAIAIAVYFIGRWIIKHLCRVLIKIFEKREVDASLRSFLVSLVKIAMTVLLLLIIIGTLGVDVTSFIALFASAGIAVGLALSGTLQNFAGGVIILLLRPFRVGDVVELQNFTGTVKEISLFSTILNTADNKTIIIPNGGISTGSVNNYSKEGTRRVDWTFGVAYGTDYDSAKAIISSLLASDERVLHDPAEPFIALHSLADSSVNIVVRVWTLSENYWGLYFDLNEKVYKNFSERDINIPFPQMDVHLHHK